VVRALCGRPRRPRSILLDFGGSLVFPLNKYIAVRAQTRACCLRRPGRLCRWLLPVLLLAS
jgi:hypothetical protein